MAVAPKKQKPAAPVAPKRSLSRAVVCISAHPDDAEAGCGGTLIRLRQEGYRVVVLYLSQGAVEDEPLDKAKTIRREEARKSCRVMGAEPVFVFDELGWPKLDDAWTAKVADHLRNTKPALVFAHWPLDSHPEHQVASLLALRAVSALENAPELYFFEVERGAQTAAFTPQVFVDIGEVRELKVKALNEHESQDPTRIYADHHEPMERFRGREAGVKAAEAFVPLRSGFTELTAALAPKTAAPR